jgi:hypothetical protein
MCEIPYVVMTIIKICFKFIRKKNYNNKNLIVEGILHIYYYVNFLFFLYVYIFIFYINIILIYYAFIFGKLIEIFLYIFLSLFIYLKKFKWSNYLLMVIQDIKDGQFSQIPQSNWDVTS